MKNKTKILIRKKAYESLKIQPYRDLMELKNKRVNDSTYSLKCFENTKSIFVHIPKSAGISITSSIYGCLAGGHLKMTDYAIAFTPRELDEFFKFTFVRNPFDRLYSAYNFLSKGGITKNDEDYNRSILSKYQNFEDFVLYGLQRSEVINHTHFIPQTNFLSLFGNLVIDFIGRFENIENDFQLVCKKLGIERSLPKKNITATGNEPIKSMYNSKMITKVTSIYASDFYNFGYRTDAKK